jgi:hypothetical protein
VGELGERVLKAGGIEIWSSGNGLLALSCMPKAFRPLARPRSCRFADLVARRGILAITVPTNWRKTSLMVAVSDTLPIELVQHVQHQPCGIQLSLFDTLGLPGMLDNAPPLIVTAVEDDHRGSAVLGSVGREGGHAFTATAIHAPACASPTGPAPLPPGELGDPQGMEMRRVLPRHNGYFRSKGPSCD